MILISEAIILILLNIGAVLFLIWLALRYKVNKMKAELRSIEFMYETITEFIPHNKHLGRRYDLY